MAISQCEPESCLLIALVIAGSITQSNVTFSSPELQTDQPHHPTTYVCEWWPMGDFATLRVSMSRVALQYCRFSYLLAYSLDVAGRYAEHLTKAGFTAIHQYAG